MSAAARSRATSRLAEERPTLTAIDSAHTALLLIDVINDMEFVGGDKLANNSPEPFERISALKKRARDHQIPVVYVNDNFGRWRSDFNQQVRHCTEDDVRGRDLSRLLAPEEDDYFVLKPKNSAFFGTTLTSLLTYLQVGTVMLTGVACDICILFTANDAHMQEYEVVVPEDCVASETSEGTAFALGLMRHALGVTAVPSTDLVFEGRFQQPRRVGQA